MNIICVCDASENTGLTVYYFTSTMTSLKYICTTEPIIDDIIHQKFASSIITVPEGVYVTVMNDYFQKLEKLCLQPSHKDTIIIIRQNDCLLLFGLAHSVKSIIAEHETLKLKYIIAQVELNLQDYQVCAKTNRVVFRRN